MTRLKLGERIRGVLEERQMTIKALADDVGMDRGQLSKLIGGSRAWRRRHAVEVAQALAMPLEELIADTEEEEALVGEATSPEEAADAREALAEAIERSQKADADAAEADAQRVAAVEEAERLRAELASRPATEELTALQQRVASLETEKKSLTAQVALRNFSVAGLMAKLATAEEQVRVADGKALQMQQAAAQNAKVAQHRHDQVQRLVEQKAELEKANFWLAHWLEKYQEACGTLSQQSVEANQRAEYNRLVAEWNAHVAKQAQAESNTMKAVAAVSVAVAVSSLSTETQKQVVGALLKPSATKRLLGPGR